MNAPAKLPRQPLNGVDTPTLLNTIRFVAGQPELAKFRFRATNEWLAGTHSRSTMHGFFGAGEPVAPHEIHFPSNAAWVCSYSALSEAFS